MEVDFSPIEGLVHHGTPTMAVTCTHDGMDF